jgi:hypothetical protein
MIASPKSQLAISFAPEHKLTVEPVPERYALGEGRVYITMSKSECGELQEWRVPCQWLPEEAGLLLNQIRGLSWQLSEEGRPFHYYEIMELCARFCKQQNIK